MQLSVHSLLFTKTKGIGQFERNIAGFSYLVIRLLGYFTLYKVRILNKDTLHMFSKILT